MNLILKTLALIGLILLLPIIFISMLLVIIEDGFPGLFIQKRLGKNKKIIKIFKIRTMKNATPDLGTHEINNSNILKTSKFIRNFKIDELPQVINYVIGDINLVGPRPGLPNQYELKKYREKEEIFNIAPGITGLSQILGYDMSNPKLLSKIDRLYIENKSLRLDLMIFLATFLPFLRKKIKIFFHVKIQEIINKLD
tara:strand:- start:2789 stop:3379 length:591 start_codon:yes stop_codon:yes gene_type:complete